MSVAPNLCCDGPRTEEHTPVRQLDQSYRLTSHLQVFPVGSQVGCGTLEEALAILAQAVCTRCPHTQTKVTKLTKPNQTRTSPAGSHTPNQTNGKDMPRNQKPNSKTLPKRWQSHAQKSKAKWQKYPKRMAKSCPEVKRQMA